MLEPPSVRGCLQGNWARWAPNCTGFQDALAHRGVHSRNAQISPPHITFSAEPTPFRGENSADLPSFKTPFPWHKTNSTPKPAHRPISERQPQRKEDEASRKRGKGGCCEGGRTYFTLLPGDGGARTYPRRPGGPQGS